MNQPAPPAIPAPGQPAPLSGPVARISVCMMVKDEEKRLPTALASVQKWVDEIIVVDTGSSDRTVEIAKEYGAKVYHHPWENNFSKHRMQSLSYATGDWLLILDADEELVQETAHLLKNVVHKTPEADRNDIGGFLFELYNDVTAGGETFLLHPRLFRRGRVRYEGKVHNRPLVNGKMARSGIKLIHYGYNEDPATMARKHQRRTDMIRKWCEEEPDNFMGHSYLAHTLLGQRETVPEAVEEAATALELLRRTKGEERFFPHVYYPLINGLAALQRDQEVFQYVKECLEYAPYYPDPIFFRLAIHFKNRDWEKVCADAAQFVQMQDECREHPERFVFFENMTFDQYQYVLFRWVVAAAHLEEREQVLSAYQRMLDEREAEGSSQRTVQAILGLNFPDLALELVELAGQKHPQWAWVDQARPVLSQKTREHQAQRLREQGAEALRQGQVDQAASYLRQALEHSPQDPEVLLDLGQALSQQGQVDQAEEWLMRGLNLHPGHPWAWKQLAEAGFGRGDYAGAQACYRRYLDQVDRDEAVSGRLKVCARRLAEGPPTVAGSSPRLLVFLVGGLSPEMVRQPAPHFLMGRAWGELGPSIDPPPDAPNWATIYCGVSPEQHGLSQEPTRQQPMGLSQLKVPSMWEILAESYRVGLAGIPLGSPPPAFAAWSLAGLPGGPLHPGLVHPPHLALMALGAGYRCDFALNEFQDQTFRQTIEADIRQEAFLYQVDRNKLTTAMAMPAVDVLVLGFNCLERIQATFDLASHKTFSAYQQVYGWMETTLAALRPQAFMVLGQRGYAQRQAQPQGGGFYCLSWLKGENRTANYTDVAPQVLKLMGLDPSRLGQARGGRWKSWGETPFCEQKGGFPPDPSSPKKL